MERELLAKKAKTKQSTKQAWGSCFFKNAVWEQSGRNKENEENSPPATKVLCLVYSSNRLLDAKALGGILHRQAGRGPVGRDVCIIMIFQGVGLWEALQGVESVKANHKCERGDLFSDCERELVSNGFEQSKAGVTPL